MFFTYSDILLLSKRLKKLPKNVDEELRGWNWNEPPVYTRSLSQVSVSDLNYCSTLRNIYLKVKGFKGDIGKQILQGSLIHMVYAFGVETVKRLIYSKDGIDGSTLRTLMGDEFYSLLKDLKDEDAKYAKVLWDHITNIYSAELDRVRSRFTNLTRDSLVSQVVPFYVEFPVDGSFLGLTNLRVDAFVPHLPLIAEMKTGKYRYAHELSLAGYALAIESQYEIPIDYGYLCYVNVTDRDVRSNCKLVPISDAIRSEFLDMRDKAQDIMDKGIDPGIAKDCERDCMFYRVCHP
ncbi:type I-A CRISPR-associated protein Cas4/Csa1 [Sulfolobus sp. E5-1-F]|uniref:type I-A CRISPR-associated protein Cas4/Csa1 n=1 Tax=Saccharolobus sp. E5-1-F TaxID=2663019 RepID=UPI00129787AB|nr:type I-A CRISPR-associated protein Cas4/Csa1 [Sulfolobus sp. E5-1-F]QGA53967.1 type I-A CRISPR-associated protein Cas4/Csa1 [Sulfolobus sp. E5-1-F]